MKHLLTGCIALFITLSAAAQPIPSFDCPDSSHWQGLVSPPPPHSYVIAGFEPCPNPIADQGNFLYWNEHGPFEISLNSSDVTSWNASTIYGLKGHQGMDIAPGSPVLDIPVFETHMQPDAEFLQSPTFPEFKFRSGKYKFDVLLADESTVIRVGSGAEVQVDHSVVLMPNSSIVVDPGGKLVLNSTATTHCVIDNRGGTIDGIITRNLYYTFSFVNEDWTEAAPIVSQSFVFNPGLREVNMHKVMKDVQTALGITYIDGTTEYPTVQASTWGHQEYLPIQLPYIADHGYMSDESWSAMLDTYDGGFPPVSDNLNSHLYWGGPVGLDGHHDIQLTFTNGDADIHKRGPIVGPYGFSKHMGVASYPLYKNSDNTLTDLFYDDQLLSLVSGATGGTDAFQAQAATYADGIVPFIIKVTDFPAYDEVTSMTLAVEGRWDGESTVLFQKLDAYNDTKEEYEYFQDTLYHTYVETGMSVPADVYVDPTSYPFLDLATAAITNSSGDNRYSFIDMTGFGLLHNPTNNHSSTLQLALQASIQAPFSQLAFYDISALAPDLNQRTVEEVNGMITEARQLALPIVSNFVPLPTLDNTGTVFFDLCNIEGLDYPTPLHIGDTLHANGAVGFNLTDPFDASRYQSSNITFNFPNSASQRTNYTYMGANPFNDDGVFGGEVSFLLDALAGYDPPLDLYSYETGSGNVFTGGSPENNYVPTDAMSLTSLELLNNLTLLRLKGDDPDGNTKTLGLIPLAFNESFDSNSPDKFRSSVAVNPGFYIINPKSTNPAEMMVGAFTAGLNEAPQDFYVVVNPDLLPAGMNYDNLIIDVVCSQDPMPVWEHQWHWTVDHDLDDTPDHYLHGLEDWEISTSADESYTYDELYPNSNIDEAYNGKIIKISSSPFLLDGNHDGCISTTDFIAFLGHFGTSADASNWMYDADNNGTIGSSDLIIFLNLFDTCVDDLNWNPMMEQRTNRIDRVETMLRLENVSRPAHSTYNIWTDYNWPDAVFREAIREYADPRTAVLIADEYGLIWHTCYLKDGDITLPNKLPSSAELIAADHLSGGGPLDVGYRVYFQTKFPIDIPNHPVAQDIICLGCPTSLYPTNPTPTLPDFD